MVNARGASANVTFKYGITADLSGMIATANATESPVSGSSNTSVSLGLTGLTPGTTYYFQVMAVNSIGSANGTILNFTTLAAPIATTNAASSITSTSGTLNGMVNARGASANVTFKYGTVSDLSSGTTTTAAVGSPVTGSSDTAVSLGLTGLTPGTTY